MERQIIITVTDIAPGGKNLKFTAKGFHQYELLGIMASYTEAIKKSLSKKIAKSETMKIEK